MTALDPPLLWPKMFEQLQRCKQAGLVPEVEIVIRPVCACGHSALAHVFVTCSIPAHCHSRAFCCICDCSGYKPAPTLIEKETDRMSSQPIDDHKATVKAATTSTKVSSILMNLFENVFLPILPSILLTLAPKISSNPKLLRVLQDVDKVLDSIPGVETGE